MGTSDPKPPSVKHPMGQLCPELRAPQEGGEEDKPGSSRAPDLLPASRQEALAGSSSPSHERVMPRAMLELQRELCIGVALGTPASSTTPPYLLSQGESTSGMCMRCWGWSLGLAHTRKCSTSSNPGTPDRS